MNIFANFDAITQKLHAFSGFGIPIRNSHWLIILGIYFLFCFGDLFGQSRFCRLELVDDIANIVYFMTTVNLLLFMLCRKPCGRYRLVVGGDFPEKMPMCNVFSFTINRSKSCLRSS